MGGRRGATAEMGRGSCKIALMAYGTVGGLVAGEYGRGRGIELYYAGLGGTLRMVCKSTLMR